MTTLEVSTSTTERSSTMIDTSAHDGNNESVKFVNYLVNRKDIQINRRLMFPPSDLIERIASFPDDAEGYHNHYNFEPVERFKDYSGKLQLAFDCLVIDIDVKGGATLQDQIETAWLETKKVSAHFQNLGAKTEIYFSGAKGFHIYLHRTALGLGEVLDGPDDCVMFIHELSQQFQFIDTSIANSTRKMRAFGTVNKTTGLYKIRVTTDQEVSDILDSAKERQSIEEFVLPSSGPQIWRSKNKTAKRALAIVARANGEPGPVSHQIFEQKKCILKMLNTHSEINGINRHDLSVRIANYFYFIGAAYDVAESKVRTWAEKTFGQDEDKAKRVDEALRALSDAYHGKAYDFGCYDEIKKMFCNSKCGLYEGLDPLRRAAPAMLSARQRRELEIAKKKQGVEVNGIAEKFVSFPDISPKTGEPLQTIENVRAVMNSMGIEGWFNEIAKRIEFNITERNAAKIFELDDVPSAVISEMVRLGISGTNNARAFIFKICREKTYNPVIEWIDSKPWDGVDRIEELYSTVVVNNEDQPDVLKRKKLYIRKWLISAVALAYSKKPTSAEGTLVFLSGQGDGKSSWLTSLVPGESEFAQKGLTIKPESKDSVKKVIRYWLVELGELPRMMKLDPDGLKAWLTDEFDEMRPPYGVGEVKFPRRTVTFASVNDPIFLVDETGSRRFWVLDVERVNWQHGIDVQQLWAQVKTLLMAGEKWFLTPEEREDLELSNDKFKSEHPIVEKLKEKLVEKGQEHPSDKEFYTVNLTLTGIAEWLLGSNKTITKVQTLALGKYLRLNGYEQDWRRRYEIILLGKSFDDEQREKMAEKMRSIDNMTHRPTHPAHLHRD